MKGILNLLAKLHAHRSIDQINVENKNHENIYIRWEEQRIGNPNQQHQKLRIPYKAEKQRQKNIVKERRKKEAYTLVNLPEKQPVREA